MAKTITQLPDATVVNAADELIVQQGGVTKRATKTEVLNGIVNANVDAAAAIAGTKISPDFGSQNITTTGSTGIGTSSVPGKFRVSGADQAAIGLINGASYGVRFGSASGNGAYVEGVDVDGVTSYQPLIVGGSTLQLATGGNERMRIDASGNVLIATSTALDLTTGSGTGFTYVNAFPELRLSNNNGGACAMRRTGTDGTIVNFFKGTSSVGTISVTTTATAYNTSSDYRLKDSPQPMVGSLSRLSQVNPVTFTWKSNGAQGEGFIAHELQAVVPEAVTGEKDAVDAEGNPQYQGVDASKLVPLLVAAVQELSAKVATLEAAQNS